MRCIEGVSSTYSCRSLFKKYRVLPMPCIYIRELVTFIFSNKNNLLPNSATHSYRTRGCDNLRVPFRHLSLTYNTPTCLGTKLYNKLPQGCREACNVETFRSHTKTLLLDLCCYSVSEFFEKL